MRFREAVEALAPAEQERLLNRLTLGCGRLAYAARLALADAPCGRVLDQLAAAARALTDVEAALAGRPSTAPDGRPEPAADMAGLRALSWGDLLATRPPGEAAALTADLERMAHQARALGRAVQDDGDAGHVRRHLTALLAPLADLCRRLADAIEP